MMMLTKPSFRVCCCFLEAVCRFYWSPHEVVAAVVAAVAVNVTDGDFCPDEADATVGLEDDTGESDDCWCAGTLRD